MNEAYDYSADILPAGDNLLASIAVLAQEQVEQARVVDQAEEVLKTAKDSYRDIATRRLPELMAAAGQQKITTATGLVVDVKDILRASIPEARATEALAWLEANGHGPVIKQEMKVQFERGEKADEQIEKICAAIRRENDESFLGRLKANAMLAMKHFFLLGGVEITIKRTVHPQTLAALLRELLAKGDSVDLEMFGAIVQKEAKITAVKK